MKSISFFFLLALALICQGGTFKLCGQGNPGGNILSGAEKYALMEEESPFAGIEWTSIGPEFQGGRVETIDCPLDQPGVIYAGFGSGSLWKTTNDGYNWECIFKNEYTQSIGDLAISLSNPDILYLGTGESLRASRGFSIPGAGIYKSTDGGKTWYNKGLTESQHIGRIVVDPADPNIVFAAVIGNFWSKSKDRGLYMTKDGGQTWVNILYISDSTGVADVAWDSRNKILYAASWDMISGTGSSVYRTKNLGYDWEKIETGIPIGKNTGRIGLAISPSRPETVYAVVDNRDNTDPESSSPVKGAEVYRSDDYGNRWVKTHNKPIDNYSGFGYAFGDIKVSPFDHNKIYILGVYLMESSDGGKTFRRIGGKISHIRDSRASTLHLDQHDLYIDPLHPDHLVLGNDGGVYLTYDHGSSWVHCNTVPAGEFYDISAVDGDTIRLYGGTQDNSGIMGQLLPDQPEFSNKTWKYVWLDPWSGGDGFTTLECPGQPDLVYYGSQNGSLSLKNMITGETKYIRPVPDEDENPLRFSWFTPYFISVHDKKSIYYGASKMYKSIDMGESWIRLSHDLSFSEDDMKKSRSITSIAESPLLPGLIFAATEKGSVWVSRNDGVKWFEISDGIVNSKVVDIVPSSHNSSKVYLVTKGMDNDDYSPYVYVSGNLGKNWEVISSTLPYESVNCLLEDPVIEGLLYIGTDRGVYCSPDEGKKWYSFGKTLPTVSVHKLLFIKENDYMLAGTHGMSIFLSYTEPIRVYFANSSGEGPYFMTAVDAYLPLENDFSGDFDLSTTGKLSVSFIWPERENLEVGIQDEQGNVVYHEEVRSLKGINNWKWDLIIEKKEDNTLYPVPEIKFPETGYFKIVVKGPSGQINGPVQIKRRR